jgi:hypothetical protein
MKPHGGTGTTPLVVNLSITWKYGNTGDRLHFQMFAAFPDRTEPPPPNWKSDISAATAPTTVLLDTACKIRFVAIFVIINRHSKLRQTL